jgi:hypothetical protein
MSNDNIAQRIEKVYMALEHTEDPRGSRSWFARRARVTPRHVSRLVAGDSPLEGPVLSVLELLESASAGGWVESGEPADKEEE